MSEAPAGTATFLFSDIEGSTRLLRELGQERYEQALADYQRLVRDACAERGGYEIDTQGDAFFFAFARAKDAALAAAACQQALADGETLKARIGLHTGEARLSDGRYVGLSVHRAARVCSAAHGGQVVVSETTASVLEDEELGELTLQDVGRRSLKDFERPVTLYRLEGPGLAGHARPPKEKRHRPRPSRRLVLVLVALLLLVIAAAIVLPLALTGGSRPVKVGPTSVAVIDPETNKVVDAIELGFKSRLIAAGEGYVWVADPDTSTLVKIDPRRRKIVRRTAIDPDGIPTGLAAGEGAVWVAVNRGGKDLALLEIDPGLGASGRAIVLDSIRGLQRGTDVGVAVGAGAVWAVESAAGRVSSIDPETLHQTVVATGVQATNAIAVGEGAVWVAGISTVTRVDPGTGATTSTSALGGLGEIASIAVGGGSVWFASSADTVAWRIDPVTATPRGTTPVGKGPSGVAVGEGGVWVASSGDGTVARIDARTVATIRLAQSPGSLVARYDLVWVSPGTPVGGGAG